MSRKNNKNEIFHEFLDDFLNKIHFVAIEQGDFLILHILHEVQMLFAAALLMFCA